MLSFQVRSKKRAMKRPCQMLRAQPHAKPLVYKVEGLSSQGANAYEVAGSPPSYGSAIPSWRLSV